MSYNYGQLRYDTNVTYTTDVTQYCFLHDGEIDDFTDNWGIFINDNIQNTAPFCDKILRRDPSSSAPVFYGGRSYYLKFQIQRNTGTTQSFKVGLMMQKNSETENHIIQKIQNFTVIKGGINSYQTFEVIFTPSQDFDSILFEYDRTAVDYRQDQNDTKVRPIYPYIDGEESEEQEYIMGRRMVVKILRLEKIENLFSKKENYQIAESDINQITKIGIQGPPGMLVSINGQQIRIGGNGIYQLNNELITINQLGVVPIETIAQNYYKNYFIIDYEYNKKED